VNLLTQALTRGLVDRVTATNTRGNSTGDYFIDSITHTIDGKGGHSTQWLLSKAESIVPIIFDTSFFDGPGTFIPY
jgi:hypothetical protein